MENGRFPYKLYYLGGSIFNLLLAACAAFLAVRFRVVPLALCAAAEAAFLFFWSALINFIPLRTENYINHACSAVMAGKTKESLSRCHAKLNRLAAELSGVRMRDMPKDWLHMPRDYELRMADGAEEAFQLHCKRMDEHRFTEALEIADRIFAQNTEGPFPLQGDLLNNCVYLCLMEDKSAAGYKTPAWELFRSHNGGNLAALRTEYAMALLYGNDAEAARKIRLRLFQRAHRKDRVGNEVVERPSQHICTALNDLTGAARGKVERLVFFLYGFKLQVERAFRRTHQRHRADEPRQLVHGVQHLFHLVLGRNVHRQQIAMARRCVDKAFALHPSAKELKAYGFTML